MTNTLHRYSEHYAFERTSNPEPIKDDYIVFAMASRELNDDNLVEKSQLPPTGTQTQTGKHRRCHQGRYPQAAPGHEPNRPLETRSLPRPRAGDCRNRRAYHGGSGLRQLRGNESLCGGTRM